MADNNHPITPPPELVHQWAHEHFVSSGWTDASGDVSGIRQAIAIKAARWGADQELEACYEWLNFYAADVDARDLRAARRPKPQSIKQQALRILAENGKTLDGRIELEPEDIPIILSAIQSIPEK